MIFQITAYGMTETTCGGTFTRKHDVKLGSVGPVSPNLRMKVILFKGQVDLFQSNKEYSCIEKTIYEESFVCQCSEDFEKWTN